MVDAYSCGMTAYTQRMWATQGAEDRLTMLSPLPVEGGVPVDVFAVALDDPLTAHLPPFVHPAELSAEKLVTIAATLRGKVARDYATLEAIEAIGPDRIALCAKLCAEMRKTHEPIVDDPAEALARIDRVNGLLAALADTYREAK